MTTPPQSLLVPSRPLRRFGSLPERPPNTSFPDGTPATVQPELPLPPAQTLYPLGLEREPLTAGRARPTTRISNRQAAPQGIDKWQHNNALALGVLTGTETPAERASKIAAYMQTAGATGTGEAAFTQQLQKDAIALQEKLKAAGLPVGPIDGKLGDISAAAIAQGQDKLNAMGDKIGPNSTLVDIARAPATPPPVVTPQPRPALRAPAAPRMGG